MATRNEPADVLAVVSTELTEDGVEPFLDTAAAWVDDQLGDSDLSDPILTQIEKWLAAHLVTIRDPRVTRVKAGPVDVTFLADKSEAAPTEYIKIAAALDTTGAIAAVFLPPAGMSASWYVGQGFAAQ